MKLVSAAAILLTAFTGLIVPDVATAQHVRATSKWPRTCFEFCEARAARGMKDVKAMGRSYGEQIVTCAQRCAEARARCERDPSVCATLPRQ